MAVLADLQERLPALPQPVVIFYRNHLRSYLPDLSFVTLHWLYFLTTCLISSLILWGSNTPPKTANVSYTDALFLTVSAMTEAGLNTVNLSELNTWQQIILFLLIMAGSAMFVSIAILHVRKSAFEKKLEDLAERKKRHSMHLARSFTFSRSRTKRQNSLSGDESAVASGVVRGRPIRDEEKPDPDAIPTRRQTGISSAGGQALTLDTSAQGMTESAETPDRSGAGHIHFDTLQSPNNTDLPRLRTTVSRNTKLFIGAGVGIRSMENHPKFANPMVSDADEPKSQHGAGTNTLGPFTGLDQWIDSIDGKIGRNSQFHNLTEAERRRLGGIEYDAITFLSYLVPLYFFIWQLLGAIGVGAYLQSMRPDIALTNGLNPFWTGAFFAISAFNNSGMALLDANAVALQTSYYALLTLSLLILAGNTAFPSFLRLSIWIMRQSIPEKAQSRKWQKRRKILSFILQHPRRVFVYLFPAAQNWWLVFSLVCLNGLDWIAFEILNIGNKTTQSIEPKYRVLDGLFQAFAIRSGGFYVVPIANLRSGLLVLYVLMMYVSALPVAMTIRNTNVYEERSLGIFSEDLSATQSPSVQGNTRNPANPPGMIRGLKRVLTDHHSITNPQPVTTSWTRQDFVRQQLRGQLGHDLWWIALAILFITITETGQFERDPVTFATFNIIFEVVSAYGCVGVSTGVAWNAYSFCGAWHKLSKLILCAVMLRGRHRGLPVAIDKAVLLPDETLHWAEEEDSRVRRHRRDESVKRRTGTWASGMEADFDRPGRGSGEIGRVDADGITSEKPNEDRFMQDDCGPSNGEIKGWRISDDEKGEERPVQIRAKKGSGPVDTAGRMV